MTDAGPTESRDWGGNDGPIRVSDKQNPREN
jgi:hypothetical protein